MPDRHETPHTPRPAPLPGELSRGPEYTNWRPHGSGDWLLLFTLAGAGAIGLSDGRSVRLGPGEAVLFAPGAYQDYGTHQADGHWDFLWAHFHPRSHWRPWLHWQELGRGIQHAQVAVPEVREAIAGAMRRAVTMARRQTPIAPELALNALEEAVLWIHSATRQFRAWTQGDARVRRAMDYFAEHLSEPFDLEAVAQHCGISSSRLGHLFKEHLDVSPQICCEDMRLQHAKELLIRTDMSVKEIAATIGYADPLYFSKRFRRATGASPSECREQGRHATASHPR